ncbi:DNA-binding protein P3A2 isoform X3 [Anopheles stephensi]|uniref:DNA-binding protein P3A2 isoform X3 n=1 Tax=Anopheles stephensi TaxID=30069 RepID=UPI001658A0CE|nr:DNA-binding protein P3A2 isoform X3 [Anopheles stephensi]
MSLTINAVDAMEYVEDDNITGASDDDDDDNPSSPGSAYDDGNLINVAMENEVTAQLVAAGVVGVAAAAAITSSKKKKRPHSFETNPSIRKRQQNRLLRKLRQTIFEYATRVGQQAVVLVATPGKPNNIYKVFGAKPLEDVLKNLRNNVMDKLDEALAAQAPPRVQDDPSLFELPPLIIDGIPTPVEKMTQAQLRAFIPLMLKYSTGRGKPGWGRDSTRPPWWPKELPWANVRMDARTEEEKQKFTHTVLQTIQNPDGTVSLIQVDPNNPIITLPDGTTAQVQGIATLQPQGDGGVHAIQTISDGQGESMSVDLTEATLGQDGQLIITGEDGQGFPVNVSGMITVPVSAQMYQTMMANIQQVPNVDGTVCITPMQVHNIAQQQQQQTSSGVSTANTTTQNLTISTNVGAGNQHHHATAMLTNYTLSSNGALLAVPQMQQHLVPSTGKHQRGAGGSSNNGVSRSSAPSVGLPMVGLNAILPSQRGCFNISTTGHQEADASNPNLNNNNHSTTLTQHALNVHRKANVIPTGGNTILGGGAGIAANQVKFCIPKIEPMDEDKDGSVVSGDANGTPSFVIQLSGIPFTTADPKSAHQQQQLKRDIELTVNEGSHLIDALSISQKVNSNSSNSSSSSNNAPNDVDQKHFGLQSV